MATMRDIAQAVDAYAPQLDEETKVKFSMFIHNQWAGETDFTGLNMSDEWKAYNA